MDSKASPAPQPDADVPAAHVEAFARFCSFAEFYPYYLSEHRNRISRRLHFLGTSLALVLLLAAIFLQNDWMVKAGIILLALVQGYAWAWVGHFFFEHNRPATFRYPLWSLMGDWKMWAQMLTGKIPF